MVNVVVAVKTVLDNKYFEVAFAQNRGKYRNCGNDITVFTKQQNILSHKRFKNTADADHKL